MEQITEYNLIKTLKEAFPNFIPYWEAHIVKWEGYEGIIMETSSLTGYVVDVIKSQDENEIKRIFELVEFLMRNGTELVQAAIATGFLEDLLDEDPKQIQFIKFHQYLGEKTIAYCREWDRFRGIMTKGLHDDGLREP